MRRPQGYVQVIGDIQVEHDTITCAHCNRVVMVKPGTAATIYLLPQGLGPLKEEPGAMCRMCMGHVCLRCHGDGRCLPLMRRIEEAEARRRPVQV